MIIKQLTLHKTGKNVLICCGIHGNETSAILSTYTVYEQFKKYLANYKKSIPYAKNITFCFNVNSTGLELGVRQFVIKNKKKQVDLNRAFLTKHTDLDNLYPVKKVKQLIDKSDVVIDVHNSPFCAPMIIVSDDKNAKKLLCAANNINKVLYPATEGTIKSYVNSFEDKYGYTVELPGMGFYAIQGNILKNNTSILINFICGLEFSKNYKKFDLKKYRTSDLVASTTGLIINLDIDKILNTQPNYTYHKNEHICDIYDLGTGKQLEVVAPCDCYITSMYESLFVKKGQQFLSYAKL